MVPTPATVSTDPGAAHQDRRYVVTGAASGIGRGTAELLAARGARVMVNDLDKKTMLADRPRATGSGCRVLAASCDGSDGAAILNVSSAGRHGSFGPSNYSAAKAGEAIAFLLSPAPSYGTGPVLDATGAEAHW